MTTFCPNFSNKQVKKEFTELKKLFGEDWSYLLWHRNHGYSVDLTTKGSSSPLFQWFMVLNGGNRDAALRDTATALLKDYKMWKTALQSAANIATEMQAIKERAIADGTFMKAPNGKPTNLTEQLWLQVRTKAFKNWFGDWENDPDNASKVVDENGEPLVVYHGGAKDIRIFKPFSEENTNTGYGTYTDPNTGEKIPVDSENAMFFSSNPFVGTSYATMYGILHFDRLYARVEDIMFNSSEEKGLRYSVEYFKKGIEDIYKLFEELSEIEPRFARLNAYIKKLHDAGQTIQKKSEIREVIKILRNVSDKLDDYLNRRLMNRPQWEYIFDRSIKLIDEYNNPEGIKKLISGEIPETIKREWELYKKIQKHRDAQGHSKIANYEEVDLILGFGRYHLSYDGIDLRIWNPEYTDPLVKNMSEEELGQFLTDAKASAKYHLKRIKEGEDYVKVKEKSQEYGVFLNLRNPLRHDYEGTHFGQGYKWSKKYPFGYVAARLVKKALNDGNDGVVYENVYDPYLADNYGVFHPNQIKSATDNVGTFSTENDDIHYLMSKVLSHIKKRTAETYDFVSYMQKMLTVRFGSTIGNKFTKFIYKELEDVNKNGIKNIEKLYDKIDFYFNNVLRNDVLNSLNELSSKNQAAPIKKGYYRDFIIKLIKHLKNKEITGNLDEDAKLFNNNVLDLLLELMPDLYQPGRNVPKLRGRYIKRLSELLSEPEPGRQWLFQKIDKFNREEYARRNRIKTLNKLKDKTNSKVLFDRIFKRAVISDILNYLREYSAPETSDENDKIPSIQDILKNDLLIGNEDGKTTDGNQMYSVKGILRKIKENYPKYAQLCDLILNNVKGDIRAEIRVSDNAFTAANRGHYHEGEFYQYITINRNRSNSFYDDPSYVLMHEIIHSVTQQFLLEHEDVANAITNYMEYIATSPSNDFVKAELMFQRGMAVDKDGKFDPHEFIAEFFSNDVFRDLLTHIPAQDEKQFNNIFEQIWDYIVRLFTGKSENAFELILPVMRSTLEAGINSTEYRDLLEHIDFNLTDNEDSEDGYNHERALESVKRQYTSPQTRVEEIGTEDALMSQEETIKGELGVNKEQLIALLGSTMYKANVQETAIKELVQNAFDAVKIAKSQNPNHKSSITVDINSNERTVQVSDNGTGMSTEIVQKAFFTIGGSYKGDNVDNRLKSGGLGLAKMAFLFSSEYIEVTTVKDGVKTYVKATSEEIQHENFNISVSKTTEPNGTTVKVKVPQSYIDGNGETKPISFSTYSSFLDQPIIGDVDFTIIKNGTKITKNTLDDLRDYVKLGTATSDFGEIEIYVRENKSKYNSGVPYKVLISGLYQFKKEANYPGWSGPKQLIDVIINILPTVGVKSPTYPINNLREGFRGVVDPEVADLNFLLLKINTAICNSSIASAFRGAVSMDVDDIAKVERKHTTDDSFKKAISDTKKWFLDDNTTSTTTSSDTKDKPSSDDGYLKDIAINIKKIRALRESENDKDRSSSLRHNIKIKDNGISAVDTSELDLSKPVFHNNTTMLIEDDGKLLLKKLGSLLMELKELYILTYENSPENSRFGKRIAEYVKTQYWGFSFDKSYGGVNVDPSVFSFLSINPFYTIIDDFLDNGDVDPALMMTEYITHLIIHEFNHNYLSGEGAGFTGRFPRTYAEFAGIGRQFNKDFKNRLYKLIKDNIDIFIKYGIRYHQSENIGESFNNDKILETRKGTNRSSKSNGENLQRDGVGENVSGYGEEVRALSEAIDDLDERPLSLLSAGDRDDKAQKHLKKYLPPVTERVNITTEDPIMSSTGGPTISLSTMSNALQNINNAQNVQDEIAKKIANLFKILYQSYERMPNKTPRRQQIQNEIFETLSKLKKLSNNESLLTALSHAILLLGSVDNTSGQPSSTSGLYNWLLRASKQLNPFSNITPTQLVDAFQYGIGFYIQLDKDLPPSDAPGLTREVRDMIDEFRAILPQVYNLWKQATVITGSRTVDEIIDENVVLDKDVKERHKQVTKDFLTKNFQHGDISIFHSYVLNFGHSTNPVVKHAFHEIGYAELAVNEEMFEINNRLFKALRKADRLWHLRGKKWQWMFMEKDRKGIPTGLFIRPINYGQYRLDLDEFIQLLNDEFDEDFGHHYYYDELGNAYNSATDEPASNETWEGPILGLYSEPDYIYYLKRIEQWKCEHAERRYTREYYLERLSVPYNGEEDPQNARFGSQFNHGLSPMTLLEHDRILKNINYYLSLCTDENGYVRIEKLDPDSRAKLQMWRDLMEDLQNPFNLDGTYKDGDDLKMAFELRAWNKWVNENTDTYVDMDAFEEESNKIYKECQETGDFTPYNDFYKYNTRIAIHPQFLRQTLGLFDGETAAVNGEASPEAVRAKLLRQSLESLVKTPTGRTKDLQSKERNFIFWTFCKIADQEYANAEKGKHSKEFAETMDHYFKHSEIEYRDEYGRARDIYGNVVAPEDEENTVLLTYRSYLINMFVKEIMDTGTIAGYLDENGQPISNITGTEEEIRDFVEDMFSYTETYTDEHGLIVEKQRPLSIFTLFTPRQDTFVDKTTGKTEKTIQNIPTGRFSHKYGHLVNHKYDIKDSNAEQPKRALYDNSKAYNKVMDNENTRELYETMIDIMKYSQRQYNSKNTIFNYQLPKMNASAGAMWTRLFADVIRGKKSFLDKFKTLWSYWSEVQPDDDFVYVGKDQRNPDGTYGNNIPLKLVGLLEDRSTYTSDLVGAVSAFADMALNFREKNKIIDKLKVLEYNLQDEVRDYNTESGRNKFNTAKNSAELFKQMMASHVYGNEALADPTKNTGLRMMTRKAAAVFKMIETMLMLALNVMSFSVGGGDAIFKLILYSATGKYQNLYNLTIGLLNTIKALPQILLNIGNPIPANKTGAMMKLFGISKTAKQSAKHSNWGRVSKIIPQILMGGFSMVDYFLNAISLRTTMSACRFYGGMKDDNGKEIIKPGFYTRYQLKQAFRDAGLKNPTMRSTAAHLFSTTSMWDAYNWNWMSHTLTVKDKYKPYINAKNKTLMHTLNMQRNALQNGMNPDNDQNKLHKNMATRMLMGMRFFLMLMYQHLMLQGDETTVRDMITKPKKKIVHGKERYMGEEVYKSKMTDEQRNQRVRWNAETGQPEDQIFVGLTRCISTLSKKFARLITGNIKGAKSIKFSNVEKYAARDALIFACMMAALHMGIVAVTNAAFSTYVPPEDRREAGPESISDVSRYMEEQYIGNNGYMIQLADFMFRTYEAQLTGINPSTTMDFITSLTVFKGGLDQLLRGFDLLADYMHWSDYDMNDPVKQGGFKHYARWERDVHNMFGPLRNLHTSFTTEGLKANMRYYVNNYGWTFKITGTDLSKMMTPEKKKKNKSNDDLGLDLDLDLDLDMDLDLDATF